LPAQHFIRPSRIYHGGVSSPSRPWRTLWATAIYASQLAAVFGAPDPDPSPSRPTWIVTHSPLVGVVGVCSEESDPGGSRWARVPATYPAKRPTASKARIFKCEN